MRTGVHAPRSTRWAVFRMSLKSLPETGILATRAQASREEPMAGDQGRVPDRTDRESIEVEKEADTDRRAFAEDAGRVAQAAGVKMLVLSHLVPADDPAITEQMWIDAARVHFHGPVVVGKDLLEI